jgi:hypothetical protein
MVGGGGTGDDGGFPAGFSGVDPQMMGQLIAALDKSREVLTDVPARWRRMLSPFAEVDTGPLRRLDEMAHWIDGQLPGLQRRQQAILSMDAGVTFTGLQLYYESRFASQAAAQKYGQSLARRLLNIKHAINYKDVLSSLGDNRYDPDVTAAFFATLGAQRTRLLPLEVNRSDNPNKDQQIVAISDAFGTAVSAGSQVSGMEHLRQEMPQITGNADDERGLAKLLSHGRFSADWLAEVIRAHAIEPVLHPSDPSAGLPQAYTAFLRALARNPAAARLALEGDPGIQSPSLQPLSALSSAGLSGQNALASTLTKLTSAGMDDAAAANELGKVLASAAGATDETDGNHSGEAAWFAYTIITTLGGFNQHSLLSPPGVNENLKVSLSQIAGSYATELTAGANLNDEHSDLGSSFRPQVKSIIPGLDPMFQLSPKDTYAFLQTFADTDANVQLFAQGMGVLTQRLEALGVQIEKDRRPGDKATRGLEWILESIGYITGLQLAAEEKVRGELDKQDEDSRKMTQHLLGAESSALGFFGPEVLGLEVIFEAGLYAVGEASGAALDAVGNPRTKALSRQEAALALSGHYNIVKALLDGGYKLEVTPADFSKAHPSIVDSSGHLLSWGDLAKDTNRLKSYKDWLQANGMASGADDSFGRLSVKASHEFLGGKDDGQMAAQGW